MRNCRSLEEALDVLKPYVAKAREDESITWIFGGQWNVNIWDKPVVPDRKALDSVIARTSPWHRVHGLAHPVAQFQGSRRTRPGPRRA